ncbi:holo-ACP synthase [Alkalicoccus urumqiensis]|uniref:Holo-[acyl-carrier-protein] synthase n=1 Tax=Alkalicoccus urumqiensis TaxID=1548213 RepID=A0A2P6MHY7_ALKUR|nr:holo-ACP synthase [Alkalicoccus urumqiensis]PRO65901.1 holo-[acyl-carrier-protein] synthase [Alkalicoccus urumqiensis]
MIEGTGIDVIEIERVEKAGKRLAERVLTDMERQEFERLEGRRRWEYLAGRYCVKEAYAKANGTGIGTNVSFQDITTVRSENGRPYLTVRREARRLHVSISHTHDLACAQVIIES